VSCMAMREGSWNPGQERYSWPSFSAPQKQTVRCFPVKPCLPLFGGVDVNPIQPLASHSRPILKGDPARVREDTQVKISNNHSNCCTSPNACARSKGLQYPDFIPPREPPHSLRRKNNVPYALLRAWI